MVAYLKRHLVTSPVACSTASFTRTAATVRLRRMQTLRSIAIVTVDVVVAGDKARSPTHPQTCRGAAAALHEEKVPAQRSDHAALPH
jgi:hypothetical protein